MRDLLILAQVAASEAAEAVTQTTASTGGVSDLLWQALIAAAVTVAIGFLHYKQAITLARIQKTGVDTHTLVNKNYGIQLKMTETALRRLAEHTKDPVDIAAAEEAGRLYQEHMAMQAIVDAAARK